MKHKRSVCFWIIGSALVGGLVVLTLSRNSGKDAQSARREAVFASLAARRRLSFDYGPSNREQASPTVYSDMAAHAASTAEWKTPTNAAELAELANWMRSLPHEELLRLTNADYDFKDSAFIDMLQSLEGPWVVKAMADIALLESDALIKASMVEGLAGAVHFARLKDVELMPSLEALMPQFIDGDADPYQVGRDLVSNLWMACNTQGADYIAKTQHLLEGSTNQLLLITGYDLMTNAPGGLDVLQKVILKHPSRDGRLGALEGIRQAGQDDRLDPNEVARLGREALGQETDRRNQLLLVEMLGSTGGSEGLLVLEELLADPQGKLKAEAATTLAISMEPSRARATLEAALEQTSDSKERGGLYLALAAVPGPEGATRVLEIALDPTTPSQERLSSLRGLWNAELTPAMVPELTKLVADKGDPAMRVEAMRMLFYSGATEEMPDLRSLATEDPDPSVRAQAVGLAAMHQSEDIRGWLEERLLNDRSPQVKTEALSAMVMHAHMGGRPEQTSEYLDLARKLTNDKKTLALIDRGQDLLASYDPRKLDVGMKNEAAFWGKLGQYTSGASARQFDQQSKMLEHLAKALSVDPD